MASGGSANENTPCQRQVKVALVMIAGLLLAVNLLVSTQYMRVSESGEVLEQRHGAHSMLPTGGNDTKQAPVSSIYLVKIHKAGSTTLQNILYRFGVSHNLKTAVYDRPFGMPFPDIARPRYLFEDSGRPDFVPYDLVVDHSVYSKQYPIAYMAPGVKTIASLREPMSYLKSAFSFFKLQTKFQLQKSKNPVRDFLFRDPETFHGKFAHAYNWTNNLQLFSFGYPDRRDNNATHILQFIKSEIEPSIDYMLTLDRFDEGLVLLKKKFRWNIKDIVYKVLWSTAKSRKMPTQTNSTVIQQMHDIYKQFSRGDFLLYDYFSQKVNLELDTQGATFQAEVDEFREINRNISRFCSTVCAHFNRSTMVHMPKRRIMRFLQHSIHIPASDYHGGFSWSFSQCALMGFFTFDFQVAIRVHQFPQVCAGPQRKLKKSRWEAPNQRSYRMYWCDTQSHVIYSFPWRMLLKTFLKTCH